MEEGFDAGLLRGRGLQGADSGLLPRPHLHLSCLVKNMLVRMCDQVVISCQTVSCFMSTRSFLLQQN